MTNAQRQEGLRERRREEGLKTLKLSLRSQVIDQFDALRGEGVTREDQFEALVTAAGRRRRA